MGRLYRKDTKALVPNLVLIEGTASIAAGGAVSSYTTAGGQFTVTCPTAGTYRVNLGKSTSAPDQYAGNIAAAVATLECSTDCGYVPQIKAASVSAAALPFVMT